MYKEGIKREKEREEEREKGMKTRAKKGRMKGTK